MRTVAPFRLIRMTVPLCSIGAMLAAFRRAFRERGHIAGPVRVVEWEGVEPPLPNRPALRAGDRNFLARLRRAAASSDRTLLIVKGGREPPFHTFPPRVERSGSGGTSLDRSGLSSGKELSPRSRTARRFAPAIETSLPASGGLRQVPIGRY